MKKKIGPPYSIPEQRLIERVSVEKLEERLGSFFEQSDLDLIWPEARETSLKRRRKGCESVTIDRSPKRNRIRSVSNIKNNSPPRVPRGTLREGRRRVDWGAPRDETHGVK